MGLYILLVYIHILSAIFWVGYTLFWLIIVPPLKSEFSQTEGRNLINHIVSAKWPPFFVPEPLRLKFTSLGWACLAVLAATGLGSLCLRDITFQEFSLRHLFTEGLGLLGAGKLFLIVITISFEFFAKERSVKQARLVFLMTLLIVGFSALMVR